jgi:arylsulfatase A-like enzyme
MSPPSVARPAARPAALARAVLTSPPLIGAAYVLGLAAWAGQRGASDDVDLGDVRRAEAMASFIEKRFAAEIGQMKVAIVATAIATGLVVGLVVSFLFWLRAREQVRAGRGAVEGRSGLASALRALGASLVGVVCVHGALVLWAMADSPQLYAAGWYARGGAARLVQVVATDVLGPRGVLGTALACALIFVGPAPLVSAARRLVAAWRTSAEPELKRLLARLGAGAGAVIAFGAASSIGSTGDASPSSPPPPAPSALPPSSVRRPNILLLAADSLRADRLDARVAPNLAALAERGTRFDRAYVSIPRTFPSWVTILTGRHAHHHGVRSMFPTWEDRAKDFDALPARLAQAGYQTGVVSDYAGDIFGRIELGFGTVETPSFDFRQLIRQRALERETPLLPVLHSRLGRLVFPVMRELNAAADPHLLAADVSSRLHAMRAASGASPFFLTVFFSTAHFPYASPAPFYAKYTDPAYRGRFKYHKPVGLGEELAPDAADVRQVQALYDGAVSAIDDAVGQVLGTLRSEGLADDTIVVVTADHGETLYDHGHGQGHGDHLFGDEGTHVPLVIVDPRLGADGGKRREARIARDVDLAPTLYALAGVLPPPSLDGRSLAPALRGAPIEPKPAFAETELWFTEEIAGLAEDLRIPYPGIMGLTEIDARHNAEIVMRREMVPITRMARHRMVREERLKLVYVPTRKGVRYMLFDTIEDPGETTDLAAARPADVKRLSAELWRWMLEDPQMEQRDGYLVPRAGSGASAKSAGGAP